MKYVHVCITPLPYRNPGQKIEGDGGSASTCGSDLAYNLVSSPLQKVRPNGVTSSLLSYIYIVCIWRGRAMYEYREIYIMYVYPYMYVFIYVCLSIYFRLLFAKDQWNPPDVDNIAGFHKRTSSCLLEISVKYKK